MRTALLALLLTSPLSAQVPADAVVKIPSHGASATVIWTGPGRTLLLGCAHAYEGRDRGKPMEVLVPVPQPGRDVPCTIRLLAVDYEADLSLVEINQGPFPYAAFVPSAAYTPGRVTSAGYDRMGGLVKAPVHLCTTYTVERPIPGRSGGGLIDDRGQLVGVCQGYEVTGRRRGMYVDLPTIQRFLGRQGWAVDGGYRVEQRGDMRPQQPGPALIRMPQRPCPT